MSNRQRYSLPIAVFMILKKENQILLIQRASTWRMDGYRSLLAWSLDPGEELKLAAMREAKEEIWVDIQYEDVQLIHTQHCSMEHNQWINYFFLTEIRDGEPQVCEPHKHSGVLRCSLDQLPETMIPYVKKSLDEYFQNNLNYSEFGRPANT